MSLCSHITLHVQYYSNKVQDDLRFIVYMRGKHQSHSPKKTGGKVEFESHSLFWAFPSHYQASRLLLVALCRLKLLHRALRGVTSGSRVLFQNGCKVYSKRLRNVGSGAKEAMHRTKVWVFEAGAIPIVLPCSLTSIATSLMISFTSCTSRLI
jgi:hypothetical protein